MRNSLKELIFEEIKDKPITKEDLKEWGNYPLDFLVDILNGSYDLEEAREDILSFRKDFQEKKNDLK